MPSLALANVLQRKGRTAISVAAVAVGVMTSLVLTGLTQGSIHEVVERMQNVDADLAVHARGWSLVLDSGWPLPLSAREKLLAVPGVAYASPIAATRFVILGQGHTAYGIDPADFRKVGGYRKILAGRELESNLEMVIDKRLADAGHFKVGDTIEAQGLRIPVVGICETGIPVRIFLPLAAVQEHIVQGDRVTFFFVKCTGPEVVDETARAIEAAFPSLQAQPLSNYYRVLTTTFLGLHQFIVAVISVALVITFLTILLTMYTAVVERTREIGILKAMGAGRWFITKEVLAESVAICSAGVVVGVLLSLAVKAVIEWGFPLLTVELRLRWLVVAAALGIVGGVLGALYPASVAARRDAVEALSYE
jgi:putative ABC transport system permease protein